MGIDIILVDGKGKAEYVLGGTIYIPKVEYIKIIRNDEVVYEGSGDVKLNFDRDEYIIEVKANGDYVTLEFENED